MDLIELGLNQTKELEILNNLLSNYTTLYKQTADPLVKTYMKYSSYLVVLKVSAILNGKMRLNDNFRDMVEKELEEMIEARHER